MSNNENKDLDELMKQATSGPEDDNDNYKTPQKKNSMKKVIVSSALGATLFIGVLVGGSLMIQKEEFVDKTEEPKWEQKEEKKEDKYVGYVFEFPIEMYPWAKETYNPDKFWNDKTTAVILEDARDYYTFFNIVSMVPSEVGGFLEGEDPGYTNDLSKQYLKNGEDNPEFSYATAEDYRKAYTTYFERLVNPIFGGWAVWETFSDNINPKSFEPIRDMFSDEWWEEKVVSGSGVNNIPVFREMKEGEYERYGVKDKGELATQYSAFFGKLDETEGRKTTVDVKGRDIHGMPIIYVKAPVKYIATGETVDKIEIKGELELTLRSSHSRVDVKNRIEISDAKLTIKK